MRLCIDMLISCVYSYLLTGCMVPMVLYVDVILLHGVSDSQTCFISNHDNFADCTYDNHGSIWLTANFVAFSHSLCPFIMPVDDKKVDLIKKLVKAARRREQFHRNKVPYLDVPRSKKIKKTRNRQFVGMSL